MMAKKDFGTDPVELVRSYGLSLAGYLRESFNAHGAIAPFVLIGKQERGWALGLRSEPPVFSDGELNEWVRVAAGGSCGAPLVIVLDHPTVTVGCLRCFFGVDVVDLFARGACT